MTNKKPKKMRLDVLLVQRGYYESTDAALRGVLAGDVRIGESACAGVPEACTPEIILQDRVTTAATAPQNGPATATAADAAQAEGYSGSLEVATSAAQKVPADVYVQVKAARKYVSRGGFKLEGALCKFGQDVRGMRCIDIGSSTGGFTDCLLQNGAASVACVDVNYGQLSWKLRSDARVTPYERSNIRTANPTKLGAPFDLLVADLSFIGLSSLAPTFAKYCERDSVLIALVKPQFESQPEEVAGGYVSSEDVRKRCVEEVKCALAQAGFKVTHSTESSIKGKKRGNIEYLVRAVYLGDY